MFSKIRINYDIIINDILPTLQNFKVVGYNLNKSKEIMIYYICTFCKTRSIPEPSLKPNDYTLSVIGINGLLMYHKKYVKVFYIFNVFTGEIFVAELKNKYYIPRNNFFNDIFGNSHGNTIEQIINFINNNKMKVFVNN